MTWQRKIVLMTHSANAMRFRKKAGLVGIILLLVGGLLWLTFGHQSPLERPVLEGKPIGYWLELMGTDINNDRDQIRDRLVSLGPLVIPPLLAALEDQPSSLKKKITTPFFLNHLPAVAKWLWRRRPSASWMAAYTLEAMPPDPRIRDGLIRTLRRATDAKEDSNIGFFAVKGLGERYTNDMATVIPALRSALKVPHGNIQGEAALTLARLGTNGLVALPDLIPLLKSTDDYVSSRTAMALGLFGPAARNALPSIRPLLTNQEPEVRRYAAVAIWRIASETGFPTKLLLSNMKSGRLQERVLASQQLWELGRSRTPDVIAALVDVIKSVPDTDNGLVNQWPRAHAAEILGKMGAEAKAALPTLVETETGDDDEWVRKVAKEAREKIEKALATPQDKVQ